MASKQEIIDNFAKWWPYALADTPQEWLDCVLPFVEQMYKMDFDLDPSEIPTIPARADPKRTVLQLMDTFMDTVFWPVCDLPVKNLSLPLHMATIGSGVNRGRCMEMHMVVVGLGQTKTGEKNITRGELATRDMCEDPEMNVFNVIAFGTWLDRETFLDLMKLYPRDRLLTVWKVKGCLGLYSGPPKPVF